MRLFTLHVQFSISHTGDIKCQDITMPTMMLFADTFLFVNVLCARYTSTYGFRSFHVRRRILALLWLFLGYYIFLFFLLLLFPFIYYRLFAFFVCYFESWFFSFIMSVFGLCLNLSFYYFNVDNRSSTRSSCMRRHSLLTINCCYVCSFLDLSHH